MALFASKKKTQVPGHVCFVPDAGIALALAGSPDALHRLGAERLCAILQTCAKSAVPLVSVLIAPFNGNYSEEMLRVFLQTQREFLLAQQVRLVVLDQPSSVDSEIQTLLQELQVCTAAHAGTTLVIAPRADGRAAILHAVKRWQADMPPDTTQPLTEEALSRYLPFGKYPDPDLMVRTGCSAGRSLTLENTLLWQAAYAELYFCETAWQDFSARHFEDALAWYAQRERRFGGVTAQGA